MLGSPWSPYGVAPAGCVLTHPRRRFGEREGRRSQLHQPPDSRTAELPGPATANPTWSSALCQLYGALAAEMPGGSLQCHAASAENRGQQQLLMSGCESVSNSEGSFQHSHLPPSGQMRSMVCLQSHLASSGPGSCFPQRPTYGGALKQGLKATHFSGHLLPKVQIRTFCAGRASLATQHPI